MMRQPMHKEGIQKVCVAEVAASFGHEALAKRFIGIVPANYRSGTTPHQVELGKRRRLG